MSWFTRVALVFDDEKQTGILYIFTLIFDSQTSITCSTATESRREEEKNHASHGSVVV